MQQVLADPETAPVSNKLKALLKIAGKVQKSGKNVTPGDVDLARSNGATDLDLHDTVLIAATFCMFNRYVDGLATFQPDDDEEYEKMSAHRVKAGYNMAALNN